MQTVSEIESAVDRLSPEEFTAFRIWFEERAANDWDKQIEADVVAGKLDWLAEEARQEKRSGRLTDR